MLLQITGLNAWFTTFRAYTLFFLFKGGSNTTNIRRLCRIHVPVCFLLIFDGSNEQMIQA
jgi:hypothetical protein